VAWRWLCRVTAVLTARRKPPPPVDLYVEDLRGEYQEPQWGSWDDVHAMLTRRPCDNATLGKYKKFLSMSQDQPLLSKKRKKSNEEGDSNGHEREEDPTLP